MYSVHVYDLHVSNLHVYTSLQTVVDRHFLDLQEQRSTKTVVRSFAPDFSHSFDFSLPMISRESIHPYTVAVPLAQRLAEGSAVVDIWHKVPKSDLRAAPGGGAVVGHRLVPTFRDVCLGQTVIPLIQLLEKNSG